MMNFAFKMMKFAFKMISRGMENYTITALSPSSQYVCIYAVCLCIYMPAIDRSLSD